MGGGDGTGVILQKGLEAALNGLLLIESQDAILYVYLVQS